MNRVDIMHMHTLCESRSHRGTATSTNYLLHPLHLVRMASRCGAWRNGSRDSICYTACYKWAGRFVGEGGGTSETMARGRGVYTMVVGCDGVLITIIRIIGTNIERGMDAVDVGSRGVAGLDDAALRAADGGRAEPPMRKAIQTAGGLLSNGGQLRFGIAVEKPVVCGNPRQMGAA